MHPILNLISIYFVYIHSSVFYRNSLFVSSEIRRCFCCPNFHINSSFLFLHICFFYCNELCCCFGILGSKTNNYICYIVHRNHARRHKSVWQSTVLNFSMCYLSLHYLLSTLLKLHLWPCSLLHLHSYFIRPFNFKIPNI